MQSSPEALAEEKHATAEPYEPDPREEKDPSDRVYTIDDYMSLPEGAPYQLIGGKLIVNPSPTTFHQDLSRNLEYALFDYVKKTGSGFVFYAPLDVHFAEHDVYQPDILFVSNARRHIIGKRKINGAPDLIMEILSPSTGYYDLRKKYRVYERKHVLEYWVVDPEIKRIEVFENIDGKFRLFAEGENEGTVSSKILEGFSVNLKEVFRMSRLENEN